MMRVCNYREPYWCVLLPLTLLLTSISAEDRVLQPDEVPRLKPASAEKHPMGGVMLIYRDGQRIWKTSDGKWILLDSQAAVPAPKPPARSADNQTRRGPPGPSPLQPAEPPSTTVTQNGEVKTRGGDKPATAAPATSPSLEPANGVSLKPRKVLEWRSELIRSLAFTSENKYLVVSPKEQDCWVFDGESGAKLDTELKAVRGVTNYLTTGLQPGTIIAAEKLATRLVDVKTGKDLAVDGTTVDLFPTGGLSPSKRWLVMGGYFGGISALAPELSLSKVQDTKGTRVDEPVSGSPQAWNTTAVAYSPGDKFAAAGRSSGRMCIWTLKDNGDEGEEFPVSAHAGKVDSLAFTAAGLWSLGADGKLKLWSVPDGKELSAHSFGGELDRGWLLCDGQVAAIARKPGTGELELYRVPALADAKPDLITKIPIVSLFDGFPTVHREFTIPQLALSPDWRQLALVAKSGSSELAINQIALYDVSAIFPKPGKTATVAPGANNGSDRGRPPLTTKSAPVQAEREYRTWTSADGKFSVEAQLVSLGAGSVRLKRKDTGKIITVPLSLLTAEDQAAARNPK
jgi:hypothetical protein